MHQQTDSFIPRDFNDIRDDLKPALLDRIEDLAVQFYGEPNAGSRRRREWRWNAKGSVRVVVRGKDKGQWDDFEAHCSGDPIEMIRHNEHLDYAGALRFGCDKTGVAFYQNGAHPPPPDPTTKAKRDAEREAERAHKRAADDAEAEADQRRRITWARSWWNEAGPIAGTIGETYLRNERGIPRSASGWPDAIRYHAEAQGLVFAGTDRSGTVRFVQIIYLTKDGVKISKAEAIARELPPNAKQVHGVMPDAFIRFPGPATAPLLHGEGAETGLSLWVSTGHETRLSAGANPRNQPEAGRINVVCRDDDKHQSPADKALKAALVKWKSEGHNVRVATPWHIRRCDKSDFNDVIQADGIPAVQDRIIAALGTAHKPVNRMTADESRTALLTFISALFAEAAKWRTAMLTVDPGQSIPPYPVHGIAVDVGAGKTQIALEFIPKTVEAMRANGDKSSIVIAIPEHALGDEQMARLAAMPGGNKITAAVWRSRQAKIGDGSETKMCLDPDAVKDAELAMADVQTAVCRKKQKDGTFKECPIVPDAHG